MPRTHPGHSSHRPRGAAIRPPSRRPGRTKARRESHVRHAGKPRAHRRTCLPQGPSHRASRKPVPPAAPTGRPVPAARGHRSCPVSVRAGKGPGSARTWPVRRWPGHGRGRRQNPRQRHPRPAGARPSPARTASRRRRRRPALSRRRRLGRETPGGGDPPGSLPPRQETSRRPPPACPAAARPIRASSGRPLPWESLQPRGSRRRPSAVRQPHPGAPACTAIVRRYSATVPAESEDEPAVSGCMPGPRARNAWSAWSNRPMSKRQTAAERLPRLRCSPCAAVAAARKNGSARGYSPRAA